MKWLHFILSHSVFIAICAVALGFQTSLLLNIDVGFFVYGFIFCATLCSYNLYWVLSKLSFAAKTDIKAVLQKQGTAYLLLLISTAGVLYCYLHSAIPVKTIAIAVALTILYAIPVLPFSFLQLARRAGILKTILLAFTWAYVTVMIPLPAEQQLNAAILFMLSRRFLFMLMLCIIFDNRDKDMDKIRGLSSLATDLGPGSVRILIYSVFTLLFISNFFFRSFGITPGQSVALQVSTLALLLVYFYSQKKQGYLFYYFFVDGMMLFSALATCVAGFFS